VPTGEPAYGLLERKTSILLPARVVQIGKVMRNSLKLYVNDIEQEAVIAMNICLLN